MSKVVFKSPYVKSGKTIGGKYTNYIAKRDRVDKSINTKKVEINLNYIATGPRVEKIGEHGLFGQEDDINLKKASDNIRNHKGIVWTPIISLKREDANRLGYNNAESWRNLIRSKQFEIAEAYNIPAKDLVWYGAFHDEGYHPHIHMIVYNKNLQELYQKWCQLQLTLQGYYHKEPKKCFDELENNINFQKRLQNAVLKSALRDNRQENIYTNKADILPVYNDIIFNLCKMFEQSMQHEIEEGFTKSIVDSKERIKEYKKEHGMGMHM